MVQISFSEAKKIIWSLYSYGDNCGEAIEMMAREAFGSDYDLYKSEIKSLRSYMDSIPLSSNNQETYSEMISSKINGLAREVSK